MVSKYSSIFSIEFFYAKSFEKFLFSKADLSEKIKEAGENVRNLKSAKASKVWRDFKKKN